MIDLHGQAGLPYINRGIYTGSYKGMRFRMRKAETEEKGKYLETIIYPEPFCFDATPEEEKTIKEFPFTTEGFDEAVAWMNEEYTAQKERWEQAAKTAWT